MNGLDVIDYMRERFGEPTREDYRRVAADRQAEADLFQEMADDDSFWERDDEEDDEEVAQDPES